MNAASKFNLKYAELEKFKGMVPVQMIYLLVLLCGPSIPRAESDQEGD